MVESCNTERAKTYNMIRLRAWKKGGKKAVAAALVTRDNLEIEEESDGWVLEPEAYCSVGCGMPRSDGSRIQRSVAGTTR